MIITADTTNNTISCSICSPLCLAGKMAKIATMGTFFLPLSSAAIIKPFDMWLCDYCAMGDIYLETLFIKNLIQSDIVSPA